MSQSLEYSNLPPAKRKSLWIGAPITIAVVVSTFAYLTCRYYYREQGLMNGEAVAIWFGLIFCFACLVIASINLVREIRTGRVSFGKIFSAAGIVLGLVLIVCAIDAYFEIYGIYM